MNERKIRTPFHGLMNGARPDGRYRDEGALPVSQFEARRPPPVEVRPAAQDARDAIRRSTTRG